MDIIEINKLLAPLVTRFIKIDDYDKMVSILDIGVSGVEIIEKIKKEQQVEKEEYEDKFNLKYKKLEEYVKILKREKLKAQQELYDHNEMKGLLSYGKWR